MAVPLEKFVELLEDSGILAGDTLQDFLPPRREPKSAEELALELVRQKKLTKFQAEEVAKGKGKSLTLGNYVLMEKIGAGGMGQVFKARHRRMDRLVAVKLLPAAMTKNKDAIARFEREVKAAAKLRHTNIVAADDADQANGVHFLVMELVEGIDLSALVKKNGPVSIEKAVNYIVQAARGLEFAHKKGVIHRDIKPANLLLDTEGTIKILDMGLARIHGEAGTQAELTATGAVMGTIDYMAPEQALSTKAADARADIYSLGCSLYYLLSGKATYDGETLMAKLLAHREQPIPDLRAVCPQVPDQLEAIFKTMVAKKTEDRYQTMTEVIAALEGYGGGPSNSQISQPADTGPKSLVRDKPVSPQTVAVPADITAAESQTSAKKEAAAKSKVTSSLSLVESFSDADEFSQAPARSIRTRNLRRPGKKGKHALLQDQKKLLLIGGSILGVLILLAVVVSSFRTKDGKLIVAVNEPDAEVEVLNEEGKVEITRKGDKGPITISVVPGKHRLKIQKKGFALVTKDFEVESNGTKSISVTLVPLEPTVATTKADAAPHDSTVTADRNAAEWVLSIGGKVVVNYDYGRQIKAVSELPKEEFFVANIWLAENQKVTDRDLPRFKACQGLWLLDLVGTQVTDAGLAHVKEYVTAQGLGEVYLGNTSITDSGLAHLADCTGMHQLWIFNTAVTDAGLNHLKRMKQMTRLAAQGTRVTEAGVQKLAAALPQCQIEWDGGVIEPTRGADPE